MKHCPAPLLLALVLTLASCSGTFTHTIDFNPSDPIRVAVLPFGFTDDKGAFVDPDEDLLIDEVGLVSSKAKLPPNEFVRKLVQEEIARTGLDLVSPALVNSNFAHNGLVRESDLEPDIKKIYAADPKEVCERLLSCDAVLYGTIYRWDRSYYAIQSVSTVGIDLKMVSANTGKVLFQSRSEDSDSRGISKGPTGFSNLVIEPLKGLDNDIIADLARSTVKTGLAPLRAENRPEYLQSSPPGIFAATHDSPEGAVPSKGHLTVLALGTPGKSGFFSIGNVVENIPMIERGEGHYIGEYHPLGTDTFAKAAVTVHLTDEFGRTTSQQIGLGPVSLIR